MSEQLNGKRVPWPQLEEYLALHQGAIVSFLDQLKTKVTTEKEIESKLPRSFLNIHMLLTRILKDNNIIAIREEQNAN